MFATARPRLFTIAALTCTAMLSLATGCESAPRQGGGHIRAFSATVSPGNRVGLAEPVTVTENPQDATELRPTSDGEVTVTVSCRPMMSTSMPVRTNRRFFTLLDTAPADQVFAAAAPRMTPFASTVSPGQRGLADRWSQPVTTDVIVQSEDPAQPGDQAQKLDAETASVPVAP